MHTLDIFFCIAAVFFIVIGIRRGLIGELFRLFALIAGFIVAFLYYPDLSRLLNIKNPTIATPLCFSILYLITALSVIGAGWLIRKVVHLTPLGWFDYLFGGAIGFALGRSLAERITTRRRGDGRAVFGWTLAGGLAGTVSMYPLGGMMAGFGLLGFATAALIASRIGPWSVRHFGRIAPPSVHSNSTASYFSGMTRSPLWP